MAGRTKGPCQCPEARTPPDSPQVRLQAASVLTVASGAIAQGLSPSPLPGTARAQGGACSPGRSGSAMAGTLLGTQAWAAGLHRPRLWPEMVGGLSDPQGRGQVLHSLGDEAPGVGAVGGERLQAQPRPAVRTPHCPGSGMQLSRSMCGWRPGLGSRGPQEGPLLHRGHGGGRGNSRWGPFQMGI